MPTRAQFTAIGSTGLNRYGKRSAVYEEYNPHLRSDSESTRIFNEMSSNDPIVGAILYAIESLFRQMQWRVEPASGEPLAVEMSEFLESCIEDMSHTWNDFLSEVLTMLVHGWSYFETVYKIRKPGQSKHTDGKIGIRKLSIRSQETLSNWEFDDDGGIRGMWQNAPPTYETVFLPIEKCLLFRVRSNKNNPQGRTGGILRNAYRSWYFLKKIQEIEAIGIQRDLTGYPVIYAPQEVLAASGSTPEAATLASLKHLVQNIRRDENEGALMPPKTDRDGNPTGYGIELLTTGGSRVFNTNEIIRRYETRISQSILADFIMLGQEGVGSFALSSDKTRMFGLSIGSMRDSILDVLNRFLIPRLMEVNSWSDASLYPSFRAADVETPSLTEISQYVAQLTSVGAMQVGPKLQRKLLEIGKLPEEDYEYDSSMQQQQDNALADELLGGDEPAT